MTVPKVDETPDVEPVVVEEVQPEEETPQEPQTSEPETPEAPVEPIEAPVVKKGLMEDPDVKDLIESVRKEEKDKLYKDLEKKDQKIADQKARITSLTEQLTETGKTAEVQVAELKVVVETLQASVLDLQDEGRKKDLDLFRERALQEAGDELIIDLVGGDSEEEIAKSIEKAKVSYQEVLEKHSSKTPKQIQQEAPKPSNPQHSGGGMKKMTPAEIKALTPKEYAEYRDEIKRQQGLIK